MDHMVPLQIGREQTDVPTFKERDRQKEREVSIDREEYRNG